MESNKRILITIVVGIVLILGFFMITKNITKYTGFFITEDEDETDFIKCLDEQDVILYTNTNDLATLQNIELFDYLQYFEIVNCQGSNYLCLEKKVASFPTWIINNENIKNDINLEKLKEVSGCIESIN
tara:strand:- start:20773 stop:21159 length:387 start_codon:yes stop_codon:yes gene_type:complete